MSGTSVLIVGVGGQGVITMATMLGAAADRAGLPVRVGQLHGMSQRGGSVESTVLLGPGRSPFLPSRGADIVIALEPLELLRAAASLHPGSRVLASSSTITPSTMAVAGQPYPDTGEIFESLRASVHELVVFDGQGRATEAGCPRSVNMLALGIVAARGWLPLSAEDIEHAIERHSSGLHLRTNRLAFEVGMEGMPS